MAMNFFVGNTCLVWSLMCLTEALMIRALLLTNFKQFNGINDDFFSIFAGLINIGSSLGSHIALFTLGSLGSDEILTGIQGKPRQISPFYELTIGALSTFSCLSLMAIGFKTFEAYRKDKKLVKDINVLINNTVNITKGTLDSRPKQKLNNVRYNKPVINTVVLASLIFLIAGALLIYIAVFNINESTSDYVQSVWFGWAGAIFFRTLLPVGIVTFHLKDFRTFISKTWHSLLLNVCLKNNRIQPILDT